jgi:hypothetical protein
VWFQSTHRNISGKMFTDDVVGELEGIVALEDKVTELPCLIWSGRRSRSRIRQIMTKEITV